MKERELIRAKDRYFYIVKNRLKYKNMDFRPEHQSQAWAKVENKSKELQGITLELEKLYGLIEWVESNAEEFNDVTHSAAKSAAEFAEAESAGAESEFRGRQRSRRRSRRRTQRGSRRR